MNDICYGWDLGLLLAVNVVLFMVEGNCNEVVCFFRFFYKSIFSVCYMFYVDEEGKIFLGIFFLEFEVKIFFIFCCCI